jgi:outer membrane lipoprotein-sorting protein
VPKIRSLAAAALAAVLVSLAAGSACALTADELIANYFKAVGGLEKLTSIKTVKATGKVQMSGIELPFSMAQKRPDKLYIESDFQGTKIKQAYDGEHGWTVNPMMGTTAAQPMPALQEKAMRIQADIDGPLVGWKDKGYTVELLEDDEVEGTPVHRLRLDTGFDIVLTMCFDKENFLLIKQTAKMRHDETEIEQEVFLSDYKEVSGRLMPMAFEQRMGAQTQSHILTETVVLDEDVDDSLFVKPAAEPASETDK